MPNLPRLRALALFGRRSVEPAEPPCCRRPKTLYGALVVKSDFYSFSSLLPFPILLFGPGGAILPPRPFVPRAVARSGGQGWGPSSGPTASAARSVLDGCEHDGRMRRLGATHVASLVRESGTLLVAASQSRLGLTLRVTRPVAAGDENPRRARHWCCADRAPQPCIRSIGLRIAP